MARPTVYTQLPLPNFFAETRKKMSQLWFVDYAQRMKDALAWRKTHGVTLASTDRFKIANVGIDDQITFMDMPGAQLPVTGAVKDSERFCEFVYRNAPYITKNVFTFDTHTTWQIFHTIFLVDANGNPPDANIPISDADIQAGKYQVNKEAAYAVFGDANHYAYMARYLKHYSARLAKSKDQFPLIPWVFHSMLGGIEHALHPAIHEAAFFHEILRGTQRQIETKGGSPMSEAYSPYGEEVDLDQNNNVIGRKNVDMFNMLSEYDAVVISGQAKSHCVRAFINDHLRMVLAKDPELARKVYLVSDLTSPVVIVPGHPFLDFTSSADAAFKEFADAGMNVVESTTPMNQWPGLAGKF